MMYPTTKASDITREWHKIDVSGKVLGRIATEIANILMGKKKPYYVTHLDCGDYVVIVNAKNIVVTGKKEKQKTYYRHSGYPGGFRETTLEKVRAEHPTRILEHAVRGMLPTNKLRAKMLTRLFIFEDETHPYEDKLKAKENKG